MEDSCRADLADTQLSDILSDMEDTLPRDATPKKSQKTDAHDNPYAAEKTDAAEKPTQPRSRAARLSEETTIARKSLIEKNC